MFAYRSTSGSAPLYLNSLLQTYMPSRSLRSASERRITVPSQRGTKLLSQTFSLTVPIWWNDLELNPSSWILTHLQETAKNTSLPSLFDPLTLALSILILFYLSILFLFKKTHKHLTLYQLRIYFLTPSFFFFKLTLSFFFLYSIYSFP